MWPRYDPLAALTALRAPSFCVLGAKDRSIPLRRTVETLERLKAQRRPITTHVIPGVNHGLRDPVTGAQPDFWRPMTDWLARVGVIGPPPGKRL
jgi:acetyl esterase/lipase